MEQQPERELKVIKKPKKSTSSSTAEEATAPSKMRLNPFTGEMEAVKATPSKQARKSPSTALEKMLARTEAGPSLSSKGKSKANDGLGGGKKKSRRHMSQQEKDEEDEIRWLEYSLGKSREGADVVRDDLDDFLDDLDKFQVGMYDESGDEDEEEEDDSEDSEESESGLEEVSVSEEEETGEERSEESDKSESESEMEDEGEAEFDGLDGEGMYDFDSNDEDDFSNWDAAMATTDEEDEDDEEVEEDDSEESDLDSEAEEARALISGTATTATTSSKENAASPSDGPPAATTTKYIPPALRAKLAAEASSSAATPTTSSNDTEMDHLVAQKLRRQAQGLLNRLGDGNIDTIVTEYESLYRTHPRAHVTSTLTQLILDTITSRSNLIDTFVILHAALVAALHKVIGVEFAAFFVQRLVEELTKHYDALKKEAQGKKGAEGEEEEEGKGKECLNLSVLACELYNLHVVACPLIYDLIRMFLGQQGDEDEANFAAASTQHAIGEVDIELLLKTIRSCGHQLRTDDPSSLKSIITLTQSRVSSSSSATSTRTKFMLERMSELQKNTKGGKGGTNDASNPNSPSGQLLTRMKKYLGGMGKKRTIKSYERYVSG